MTDTPPSEHVEAFRASLPPAYRKRFSLEASAEHAAVASARRTGPANVGVYQDGGQRVVCVVASDKPGAFAQTTAALAACGLEIASAETFVRSGPLDESLQLFWIEGDQRHVDAPDLTETIQAALLGVDRGSSTADVVAKRSKRGAFDTRVRFLEAEDGGLDTLEVETGDRSGLLATLTQVLFAAGVQIVRAQISTHEGRVSDRFTLAERDGRAIDAARRLELQVTVLKAVDLAS